jgi:hypothetical protein
MGALTLYNRRHRLVRRVRGLASTYLCIRCAEDGIEKPALEWATIHGETGEDPWADYVPLCKPCHCYYDRESLQGNGRTSWTKCINGHPFDEVNTQWSQGRRRCRTCHRDWMRVHRRASLAPE